LLNWMAFRMAPTVSGVALVLRWITRSAPLPPLVEATPTGVPLRLSTSPAW